MDLRKSGPFSYIFIFKFLYRPHLQDITLLLRQFVHLGHEMSEDVLHFRAAFGRRCFQRRCLLQQLYLSRPSSPYPVDAYILQHGDSICSRITDITEGVTSRPELKIQFLHRVFSIGLRSEEIPGNLVEPVRERDPYVIEITHWTFQGFLQGLLR